LLGGCLIATVLCLLSAVGLGAGGVWWVRSTFENRTDTYDLQARIDDKLATYVSARPGSAVTVAVVQRGRIWIRGYGQLPNGQRPDGATIYQIGSVTKVFTGIALADLERTRLVMETETIAAWLGTGEYDRGNSLAAPAASLITLRQLATHTSGLPRLPAGFLASADPHQPYADTTVEQLRSAVLTATLDSSPGTSYSYSNFGAAILGQVLADRSSQSYESLITERILTPLALTDTSFTLSDDQRLRLAPPQQMNGDPGDEWAMAAYAPAGGLYATAADMARFLNANLTASPTDDGLPATLAQAQTPLYSSWGTTVAYGWHITDQIWPQRVIWHNGATGGYTSWVGFDREHQVGLVLLSNTADVVANNADLDSLAVALIGNAAKVSLALDD
jgi:CubicO group peptidase (beta-lactamase class C family)